MKRWIPFVLAVLLCGCGREDASMAQALEVRSRILGARQICFSAEITADYIDTAEEFTLNCRFDPEMVMTFSVEEPEVIRGIGGTVSGTEGTLTFDDTVLAYPLLAGDRLSPVAGPWVMMKALSTGRIQSCGMEGENIHLTVYDSYADDALQVDIWLEDGVPEQAEISHQGRRILTMEIEDFAIG